MSYEVRISILICGRSGRRGDSADRWWGMLMGRSPGRWPPRRGYLLHYRALSCQPSQCSNGASSTFRVITGAETCAGGGWDQRQCREDQVAAAPGEGWPANWVKAWFPWTVQEAWRVLGCPCPWTTVPDRAGCGAHYGRLRQEVPWWLRNWEEAAWERSPMRLCSSDLC